MIVITLKELAMPHFETMPNFDDIAPEDLLPETPKRGRKPPVQKSATATVKSSGLLPKISIKHYQPSADTSRLMDNMLQERVE